MTAIAVFFLCALPGFVLARLPAIAPVFLAAVLFAVPADEARADSGHPGGNYSLHCAAGVDNNLAAVIHLLGSAHGKNVNERDADSAHYSCSSRRSQYGRRDTPLHHAVDLNHAVIAATLIAAGADVNAKDNYGRTPLHNAAFSRYENGVSVISILLAAGADVNAKNNNGTTPLHQATSWGYSWWSSNGRPPYGRIAVVSLLLAGEADVNARDSSDRTPLHLWARDFRGYHFSVASALLKFGASARSEEICKRAFKPARFYNAESEECISFNADICGGLSPPQFYDVESEACVRLYPCHNTAIRKADNSGCECPPETFAHGDPSGGHSASRIPPTAICHANHAPLAHDPGAWLDSIRNNDLTLVAHFMRQHGQDPDDEHYHLHMAVSVGNFHLAEILLNGGANPDRQNADGSSILHFAVQRHDLDLTFLLLQRGANPNIANMNGDTPSHDAARLNDTMENTALISLLLDKGANPNLKNNDGWRPLDLAFDDGGARDPRFARRMLMLALIEGGAQWTSECSGGAIPNENYRGLAQVATYPECKCPAHISQRDSGGACECPAHSHSQVNGRCLPQDSAEVDSEIAKMQVELARLRAELVSLNARISLSAEMPREMVEDIAEQARETAAEIDWRRANFIALGRTSEAGEAPPPVALSDTAAECRMRGGEVRIDSGSGTRICLGLDQSGTFCLVDSGGAFPCRGLFKHVRLCNDVYHRPALNPFICAARCDANETARGKNCE